MDKWNNEFFPVVGDGNPRFIESWYYATWAYNGWAFANHPVGAEVDPFRALPYTCSGPFNGYAYQELVLGCVVHPPSIDDESDPLWTSIPVQLPDLAALSVDGGPLDIAQFFAGWSTVFSAPFTGDDASRPFLDMALPRPPAAEPAPDQIGELALAFAERERLFGVPLLAVDTDTLLIRVTEDRTESATITIRNMGEGLLVYRLVPTVRWLRPDVVAGVAVGSDWSVAAGAARDAVVRNYTDRRRTLRGIAQRRYHCGGAAPRWERGQLAAQRRGG